MAGNTSLAINCSSGAVSSVKHTATGAEFLSGNEVPLFSLALTLPTQHNLSVFSPLLVQSSDFRRIYTGSSSTAERLELYFADHPGAFGQDLQLSANATVFAGADGLVHFQLRVHNSGLWAVQSALYPGLEQAAILAQPHDELLYPCFEGVVLPNPGTHIGLTTPGRGMYPNGCPVQVAARYGQDAGMYLATQDGSGMVKGYHLKNSLREWVRLDILHYDTERVGTDFVVGYDTVVGTFGNGGWRTAAAMYKTWASRQPWCATKLSERHDIPDILLSGAPGVISGIQNEKGYSAVSRLGSGLEELPAYLRKYKAQINTSRMIFVPYGWENRGTWAGINYFPAIPSNASWKAANAALKAAGDATMLLVSGYWWVTKREASSGGPAFDDSTELVGPAHDMLVKLSNGSLFLDDQYNLNISKQPWRGLSVELCHGHPNSSRTLAAIASGCMHLGAEVVSFDQEIGGGQATPCYDTNHAHGPGYGKYMWTGFEGLLKQVRADAAAAGTKLGLSTEQTSELSIPYMGTYWSRQFAVTSYPSWGFNGIGLFSYLYHEYVPAMSAALVQGQGPGGVPEESDYPMRVTALANGLTRGTALVPFDHDVELSPPAADPWRGNISAAYFSFAGVVSATTLPQHCSLKCFRPGSAFHGGHGLSRVHSQQTSSSVACTPQAPVFPEYLVLGESVVPPELVCANLSSWYYHHDAKTSNVTKQPILLRSAVIGSFRSSATGAVASVVASVVHTPQTVTILSEIEPDPRNLLDEKHSRPERVNRSVVTRSVTSAVLYGGRGTELKRWEQGSPAQVECELGAFGVCILVVHK